MNLKQIETFVWVATLGSFRKAAQKLNSSQPAISSRIDALETLLGVKLFERHAGRFTLTAKGIDLLPQAQKLMRLGTQFRESACETKAMAGMLRLGVSETIVHTWLSEFLKRVHQDYPAVDIDLTVDVTANMRNELIARSLDLCFLMGPISEYSIHNEHLCSYELLWVCRPDCDMPDREVSVAELFTKPVMTYARNTRPFAEMHALTQEEAVDTPRLFPSTSLAACKRMAEDGLGIAMLPRSMVARDIAEGRLREVICVRPPADLTFTASYAREPINPLAERLSALAVAIAAETDLTDKFS